MRYIDTCTVHDVPIYVVCNMHAVGLSTARRILSQLAADDVGLIGVPLS